MSQFRDDNHNLDPMQKTLTSFVISGEDVSQRPIHVETSTGSQMSDKHITLEGKLSSSNVGSSCFSNDENYFTVPYKSDEMTESNQWLQPEHSSGSDAYKITDDGCPGKV